LNGFTVETQEVKLHRIVDHARDIIFNQLQFHLARFNFRKVKYIVDYVKKQISGITHFTQRFLRIRHQSFFFKLHFGNAQNYVHRRAYFMAHPCQKLAFNVVCHYSVFFRGKQFRYVNGIPQKRRLVSNPCNIVGRITVVAFCLRAVFHPFNNPPRIFIKPETRAETAFGVPVFLKNRITNLSYAVVLNFIILL